LSSLAQALATNINASAAAANCFLISPPDRSVLLCSHGTTKKE